MRSDIDDVAGEHARMAKVMAELFETGGVSSRASRHDAAAAAAAADGVEGPTAAPSWRCRLLECCLSLCCQRRVIRVAGRIGGIQGVWVQLIQWRVAVQADGQVGVGDEPQAKGHGIGFALGQQG